ncbi:uncharacterized protein METZ01_LOCUS183309 [marine metagenome]|uniref:Uncharacterized protein n=1 Tax=marine metagenome TaxID=408172 RepID=A0A382CWL2_9ZZZZ
MKNCDIIFFVFSMMLAPELFASPPESFYQNQWCNQNNGKVESRTTQT